MLKWLRFDGAGNRQQGRPHAWGLVQGCQKGRERPEKRRADQTRPCQTEGRLPDQPDETRQQTRPHQTRPECVLTRMLTRNRSSDQTRPGEPYNTLRWEPENILRWGALQYTSVGSPKYTTVGSPTVHYGGSPKYTSVGALKYTTVGALQYTTVGSPKYNTMGSPTIHYGGEP